MAKKRLKGVCKWFDAARGYGFILPNGGQREVFVHYTNVITEASFVTLDKNDKVEYEIGDSTRPDGKQQAVNVKVVQ